METIINLVENNLLTCSIHSLTGIDCPGCGMQRAFIALLRGHLLASFRLNPALIPLLFTILFTALHLYLDLRNGARLIVIFFSITVSLMIVNFVVKSVLPL